MTGIALGLLVIRLALGGMLAVHGLNKVFGGGGLAGTARWFEGLGLRPGWLHARLAAGNEIGAGLLMACGLAFPARRGGVHRADERGGGHRPQGQGLFRVQGRLGVRRRHRRHSGRSGQHRTRPLLPRRRRWAGTWPGPAGGLAIGVGVIAAAGLYHGPPAARRAWQRSRGRRGHAWLTGRSVVPVPWLVPSSP